MTLERKDIKIVRALLSVSDKTGLVTFAQGLAKHGVQILSTGGTARTLKDADIAITDVSSHTGFPEIMDGRVKTLHPLIHGGILANRDDENHKIAMDAHDISPIDMVVVNLYPFTDTVKSGQDFNTCIENIDIGGPSMVRSCAKNHQYTTVATDPSQYDRILDEMNGNAGATTLETRRELALSAFAHTATYDSYIAEWFSKSLEQELPHTICSVGNMKQTLRYGENPHQVAGLYATNEDRYGVTKSTQLQGKELSYNNINDADTAFEIVCEHTDTACAIIKHANPCGIAVGDTVRIAWEKALACDPISAFGGIVAFNAPVDADFARVLGDIFLEVIIAPSFTDDAIALLSEKQNLRLLATGGVCDPRTPTTLIKQIAGGILVQSRDTGIITQADCTVVTERHPTQSEWDDLMFAWRACKHVKSNAIIYAKNGHTVGIGAGQMSRVDSARLGAEKGKAFVGCENTVVASDAFFPFPDALDVCITAGATAVIQPGGSRNDAQIIETANQAGITMVFTNMRHFKH